MRHSEHAIIVLREAKILLLASRSTSLADVINTAAEQHAKQAEVVRAKRVKRAVRRAVGLVATGERKGYAEFTQSDLTAEQKISAIDKAMDFCRAEAERLDEKDSLRSDPEFNRFWDEFKRLNKSLPDNAGECMVTALRIVRPDIASKLESHPTNPLLSNDLIPLFLDQVMEMWDGKSVDS